jgi:hypothetical protein
LERCEGFAVQDRPATSELDFAVSTGEKGGTGISYLKIAGGSFKARVDKLMKRPFSIEEQFLVDNAFNWKEMEIPPEVEEVLEKRWRRLDFLGFQV